MDDIHDLKGLLASLVAFRDDVGFQLMEEVPLPADLADPLWPAFKAVCSTIERLAVVYGVTENLDGMTIYAPERSQGDE